MLRRPPKSNPFPTRRSSDLSHRGTTERQNKPSLPSSRRSRKKARPILFRSLSASPPSTTTARSGASSQCPKQNRARSEEHTSELQSLRHLVRRLLLEKKKIL